MLYLEAMLYGEPQTFLHDWRMHLKVPGLCVTEAKSLFDHLSKPGNVPQEKQTLIDCLQRGISLKPKQ